MVSPSHTIKHDLCPRLTALALAGCRTTPLHAQERGDARVPAPHLQIYNKQEVLQQVCNLYHTRTSLMSQQDTFLSSYCISHEKYFGAGHKLQYERTLNQGSYNRHSLTPYKRCWQVTKPQCACVSVIPGSQPGRASQAPPHLDRVGAAPAMLLEYRYPWKEHL